MFGKQTPSLGEYLLRPSGNFAARKPEDFLRTYVSPLLIHQTTDSPGHPEDANISTDAQFWQKSAEGYLGVVHISGLCFSDWFPRSPGVFWTHSAKVTRDSSKVKPQNFDSRLGSFVEPTMKMALVELGGVGSIRLRPRKIDGEYCYLCSAVTELGHAGIPLAIPEQLLLRADLKSGEQVVISGRVRYLQDAGLDDVAAAVHGNRPHIVFVEKIVRSRTRNTVGPVLITPVVLFEARDGAENDSRFSYTFVHCDSTKAGSIDQANDWLETYADKYEGRIITNFDEQVPRLANAPLSYQRLVTKTYERTLIQNISRYTGPVLIESLDHIEVARMDMRQNNINVGGNAIINIDSIVSQTTQLIGDSRSLDPKQKQELDSIVESLHLQLKPVEASHPDEAKAVADAVQKVVVDSSKPEAERKKPFINLSAKNLLETVKLVAEIAPKVPEWAHKLASFAQDLV